MEEKVVAKKKPEGVGGGEKEEAVEEVKGASCSEAR